MKKASPQTQNIEKKDFFICKESLDETDRSIFSGISNQ